MDNDPMTPQGPPHHLCLQSAAQTHALGLALGAALPKNALVLLEGHLGAGKTTLSKALCEAWGVAPALVHSPSYTLVNVYQGRVPIFHVDLFRLESPCALLQLPPEDWLNNAGPTLIEWPALALPMLQGMAHLEVRMAMPPSTTIPHRAPKPPCTGAASASSKTTPPPPSHDHSALRLLSAFAMYDETLAYQSALQILAAYPKPHP